MQINLVFFLQFTKFNLAICCVYAQWGWFLAHHLEYSRNCGLSWRHQASPSKWKDDDTFCFSKIIFNYSRKLKSNFVFQFRFSVAIIVYYYKVHWNMNRIPSIFSLLLKWILNESWHSIKYILFSWEPSKIVDDVNPDPIRITKIFFYRSIMKTCEHYLLTFAIVRTSEGTNA